ncbi:VWA domain-containing protein [Archangium violaceum]|uniref:vWA domain-containing protein n=1 Tax=Archangium violaceum TaxID=83451 RepID=UPI00194FEFCE|nr:VWA domain-containing protein [Archangium violaceum]QRN96865.1 VWA domain-containing protein [Archangium violaceum]
MKLTAWAVERDGERGRDVHLLVTVEAESDAPRAPVAMNLVLDRSASMRGAPLSAAVEAAQLLVERAGPKDYLGLLAFDGVPEQLVPLRLMDAEARAELSESLSALDAGEGTALHEAVESGAAAVRRMFIPGARPKMLVLTDGEPSVGRRSLADFRALGSKVAESGITLHAMGLGRHYLPEILEALTGPAGTGFTHVDDAEGLPVATAALVAELFGEVGTEARLHVRPIGFTELLCRHRYPARVEGDSMSVGLGALSSAFPRRALFTGQLELAEWSLQVTTSWAERGDTRRVTVPVQRVLPDSPEGRFVRAVGAELDLVAAEASAWKALLRRNPTAAEHALAHAEEFLRELVRLSVEQVPAKRHVDRLADLRLAVERRSGDVPALGVRRARAADAHTGLSIVQPALPIVRKARN